MSNTSIISLIFVGICATSCMGQTIDDHPAKTKAMISIEEAIKEHSEALMSLPGVVGVGQGLCAGKPCLKVYIVKMTPELEKEIPALFEGYEVSIEITGEIQAHPDK